MWQYSINLVFTKIYLGKVTHSPKQRTKNGIAMALAARSLDNKMAMLLKAQTQEAKEQSQISLYHQGLLH